LKKGALFMPEADKIRVLLISQQAWKRAIALRFEEREVWVTLHWEDQKEYSALIRTFSDEWSDDQKAEFQDWLLDSENLALLDSETAQEEVMNNNEPESKFQIHKNKLWVAWNGSWGRSDILITDDEQWTREQQIAFDKLSLSRNPEIEDVVEILTGTNKKILEVDEQ
jgi:hypothetical protein